MDALFERRAGAGGTDASMGEAAARHFSETGVLRGLRAGQCRGGQRRRGRLPKNREHAGEAAASSETGAPRAMPGWTNLPRGRIPKTA